MSKRVTRGWLVRAGIVTAMGAAAIIAAVTFGGFFGSTQSASAAGAGAPTDTMTYSLSQSGSVAPLGGTITVTVHVNNDFTDEWGGWLTDLSWGVNGAFGSSVVSGGLCSGTWGAQVVQPSLQKAGCFGADDTASGNTEVYTLTCQLPGTYTISLANDTAMFDTFSVNFTSILPAPIQITCTLPVNKADDTGGSAIVGQTVGYAVTIPNPSGVSIPGNNLHDVVPAGIVGTTIISDDGQPCVVSAGAIDCTGFEIGPSGFTLLYGGAVSPAAAGSTLCNTATLTDSNSNASVSNNDCFTVAAAGLTLTKTANTATVQAGDPLAWTVTLTSTGGSAAVNTVLTDTAGAGFVIDGTVDVTGAPACTLGTVTPGSATVNCAALTTADGPQVIVVNGHASDPQPADSTCRNSVSATSDSAGAAAGPVNATANCLSKNVRMVKSSDCDTAPTNSGENINLFIGNGPLTICEWALNVGGDPQGVGAFEFDVSYNNRIFDVSVAPTGWLYSTGRWTDEANDTDPAAGCTATVITENDVRFGCVSKNPQPLVGPAQCLGPDNATEVTGAVCGVKDNGVIATITVTPKSDLATQEIITPGNDNGVISGITDSGCELADIWGHPLSAAPAAAGLDSLGREVPLPGIAPGGQVTDCSSVAVTVRILEGDMNKDCTVDVGDDQTEAAHYGATFGSLLYDKWYDLEPALRDGDVDIKDLQKVFGRNGSTCDIPVPPQPPLPLPN